MSKERWHQGEDPHFGVDPYASTGEPATRPTMPDGAHALLEGNRRTSLTFEERYVIGEQLGVGGMGEVYSALDRTIGRHVAIKVVKPGQRTNSSVRRRFEREVRVQGQLEHPSIIPVYEFGNREDGSAYFAMKRIHGRTLRALLSELRREKHRDERERLRRRLLGAFIQLCQAIAYAHSRGVIHRDLKPTNILMGPFGEVYVLDWGIAKILNDTGYKTTKGFIDRIDPGDDANPDSLTSLGEVMGTPGYMSPEQVQGTADSIGPASDIYALGVLLFEIATGERLHRGENTGELFESTVLAEGPRARLEDSSIAEELAVICKTATDLEIGKRYRRVGDMILALERFLAGERDVSRRKELALAHIETAKKHIAGDAQGIGGLLSTRTTALRELGAALSLDPTNEEALGLAVRTVTEPGTSLPESARVELAAQAGQRQSLVARGAAFSWAAWIPLGLTLWLFGSPKPWLLGTFFLVVGAFVFYTFRLARHAGEQTPRQYLTLNLLLVLITVLCSFFAGPYLFVPALAMAWAIVATMVYSSPVARRRAPIWAIGSVILSIGIHASGLVPSSLRFEEGLISIVPVMVKFPRPLTEIACFANTVLLLIGVIVPVQTFAEEKTRNDEKLAIQAWLLRQLLPQNSKDPEAEKEDKT